MTIPEALKQGFTFPRTCFVFWRMPSNSQEGAETRQGLRISVPDLLLLSTARLSIFLDPDPFKRENFQKRVDGRTLGT